MEENQETAASETTTETQPMEQMLEGKTIDSGEAENEKEVETTQSKQKADENHPTNLGRNVKQLTEQLDNLQTNFSQLIDEMRASRQAEKPNKGETVASNFDDGLYERIVP